MSKKKKDSLEKEITKYFLDNPKKRANTKQIRASLPKRPSIESIQEVLEKLVKDNKLIKLGGYKFRLNKHAFKSIDHKTHIGYVDMTRSGSAYIVCEDYGNDIYVPSRKLNSALNGDKVSVMITSKGKRSPEGVIVDVLERATEQFIGTINISQNFAFVVPDSINRTADIFVPKSKTLHAKDNDKVIVVITDWNVGKNKSPEGEVISVLDGDDVNDIEMKSILINNGFDLLFPEEVLQESQALEKNISEAEVARRRDMRDITTFTIDPDTAKDFDDALSYRTLKNGQVEVGVHIADVTHYVQPNTALDAEAFNRSTSVYLVDRVLPMLPEELSNELCSLRPHEDKCTFSAVFIFNKDKKIINRWFGKTLTHSDRRFTYEEAQNVIETGEGDFATEILVLNEIAHHLRKQKFAEGAIAFEAEEVKFRLDENGKPIDVYVKERKDAHLLIEDFMLLANKEVARYIATKEEKEIPYVYRTHDSPDPSKLLDFANFAKGLGYKMELQTPKQIANSFNNLASAARKKPELKMLEPLAIRTMAKAEYTTNNIGHYGLGFEYYTHFTSPIRRYSDVLVHRLLEKNLESTYRTDKAALEQQCKHISKQERNAMAAERESVKYKQVEFLQEHIGKEFDGIISGIIERGFFVELLNNKCEGMIPFASMSEPISISEDRLTFKETYSGKIHKMGDTVSVIVLEANLRKKQIEMELLED